MSNDSLKLISNNRLNLIDKMNDTFYQHKYFF